MTLEFHLQNGRFPPGHRDASTGRRTVLPKEKKHRQVLLRCPGHRHPLHPDSPAPHTGTAGLRGPAHPGYVSDRIPKPSQQPSGLPVSLQFAATLAGLFLHLQTTVH